MFQGEHSAILSTFIKLPFVIYIFVLSIFEWPLKTGFTACKTASYLFFEKNYFMRQNSKFAVLISKAIEKNY